MGLGSAWPYERGDVVEAWLRPAGAVGDLVSRSVRRVVLAGVFKGVFVLGDRAAINWS